ncbi:hypothetical protein K501DRAFT_179909 [Backusella circina FSU 941]|nr:hypothetical protein K501DRAFT_179909 [Backusella circina FSU 941]
MNEKSLEKAERNLGGKKTIKVKEVEESEENKPVVYRKYKDEEKKVFFELCYKKGMSARTAVNQLKLKTHTAQDWAQKDQLNPQDIIKRKGGNGRPVGRPSNFNQEHKKYLENLVDEQPDIILQDIMTSLVNHFEGFKINQTALHNYMTEECCVALKRARHHLIERNSPKKTEERFNWVKR